MPETVGAPLVGISSTLRDYDPEAQLVPCVGGEMRSFGAAMVNLSHYDRRTDVGGELLQLGVVNSDWAGGGGPHFFYTLDWTGGGIVTLPAPYPEAGRSYELSIGPDGGYWLLTVAEAETAELLHSVRTARTWTEAGSAWLMFEVLDPASIVGSDSDPPTFAGMAVQTVDGSRPLTPPPCNVRRVRQAGDVWTYPSDVAGVRCGVALDGAFSAWR